MRFAFAKKHNDDEPLMAPLTPLQMMERVTDGDLISGTVALDPAVLHYDIEEMLDVIAEALTGSPLLEDIDHEVVGVNEEGTLAVEVSGRVSSIAESEEWEGWGDEPLCCFECGNEMVVNDDGTTNHLDDDGDVDYDQDIDHIALDPRQMEMP